MDVRSTLRSSDGPDGLCLAGGRSGRAQAYFEVAGVMLVVVGRDHRLREINRRGLDILGYDSPAEIIGRDWLEVCLPPPARAAAADWLDRFLAGDPDAPAEGAFEVQRRDGTRRLITWRHAVLRDAAGRAIAKVSSGEDVTDRRDSEARFRGLAEAVPGLLFTSDVAGGTTFVNHGFAAYTGRAAATLLGDGWRDVLHPDDLPQVAAAWSRSVETGAPYAVESRVRRQDGAWRWHLCRGLPQRDAAGNIAQWFGVAVDIDDQKRAEAAAQLAHDTLAAAERRQRFLLELSERMRAFAEPEAVIRAAASALGQELHADRAGFSEITPDGHHIVVMADWSAPGRAVPPFARSYALAEFGSGLVEALARGETLLIADTASDPQTMPHQGVFRHTGHRANLTVPLVKDGRLVALLIAQSAQPRAWSDRDAALAGEVAERTWAAVERARAEVALRASEERLSLAVEAAGLATWDVDLATGQRIWSHSHFALLGLNPACEAASEPAWSARVLPVDSAAVDAAVAAARAGDGFYRAEYRIRRADTGEERWIVSRGRFLRNGSGTWRRFVGVSLDMTERRRAEEALRDTAEELERRVAARTAELAAARDRLVEEAAQRERLEEQLRQTQKLQAVGQLAGGVAHDFNNLLTAVLGSLELLDRHVGTDAGRRLLSAARMAAERGGSLTSQLLVFARRQKLAVRALDAVALLRRMEEMLRRTLGGLITLRLELPDSACVVETDPVQLELSVLNLAINARDAMAEGGTLTVTVQLDRPPHGAPGFAEGEHVVIAVADTGPGMTEEVRARAFEPFFTTKEVGQGTGLGLAQVYGVARQCGGTARLLSVPGQGTRVEIWLPCSATRLAEAEQAAPRHDGARAHAATLLLVDDEPQVREVAAEVLRDAGYDVIEAPDGAAALAVLEGGARVDLLLTDFAMPGLTGSMLIEAARRLRPGLRALLVSGYADLGETAAAPADAQLGKPFRGADLRAAVAELLARPPAPQPLVAPAVSPAM